MREKLIEMFEAKMTDVPLSNESKAALLSLLLAAYEAGCNSGYEEGFKQGFKSGWYERSILLK